VLATFRETITSLRDPKYGSVIITKPVKPVIWYWTKYLLLVSLVPLVLAIVVLTRFLPEVPRLVEKHLPEGVLTAKDHQLSSTISQPLRWQESGFTFLFDLQASPSAIDSAENGILIMKDRVITKSSDGQFHSQNFSNLPDFSTDKHQIAAWIQSHRSRLWFSGLIIIQIAGVIIFSLTWVFRILLLLVWTVVFWLITKYLLKKSLPYFQVFNLVVYASVLPLLLSLLLTLAPNNLLSLINTGIFVYFTYSWIKNLPASSHA
jgi:hypothetical protein